jgi:hypothetical protein
VWADDTQINNSGDLFTHREDATPWCIYCRAELNNNVPHNDMTASLEHIVSLALGGTNAFSTNDASRKYNNDLGRDIDAPFMNLPLLAMKRHMLGLKGHSGTFPQIEWKIRSTKNGEPGTITIDDQGNIDVRFDRVVITDKKAQHTERLVAGSPDRVREILDGMLNATKKKGEQIYTLSGEKIQSLPDFERHFVVEDTGVLHASVGFDFVAWVRGIFKIVLGLGHIILGPNWTFSADGGDRVRSVLFVPPSDWPRSSMQGFTTGRLPTDIAKLLGISDAIRAQNQHTLAILPWKTPRAVVSLFGGNNIPEAIMSLGSEQGLLASPNETMNPDTRVGIRINPVTRDAVWLTVRDLNAAV